MIVSVNNSIILCFNPRTHGGYDVFVIGHINRKLCFNPRTHGGYDNRRTSGRIRGGCFNPRTHGGYDGEII